MGNGRECGGWGFDGDGGGWVVVGRGWGQTEEGSDGGADGKAAWGDGGGGVFGEGVMLGIRCGQDVGRQRPV